MVWPPTGVSTRPIKRLLDRLQEQSSIAIMRAATRIILFSVMYFAQRSQGSPKRIGERDDVVASDLVGVSGLPGGPISAATASRQTTCLGRCSALGAQHHLAPAEAPDCIPGSRSGLFRAPESGRSKASLLEKARKARLHRSTPSGRLAAPRVFS